MAPRLRKRQIKVTEEADVNPEDQAETVSSSEETGVTAKDQNEQDLQKDIEVKGNAPTVRTSWEKNSVEGADVHTEEKIHSSDQVAAAETVESEKQTETTSSGTAGESTEEALTHTEGTQVQQEVEEHGNKQGSQMDAVVDDNESAPTVAVTRKSKKQKKSEDAEKESDQMTPKETAGFRVFIGNLNDSKTSEEVKSSLENYLMSQSLAFQDVQLNRYKKFAFVDFASEMDLTKALTLDGEVFLDRPIKIAKAIGKSAAKPKASVPAVGKKARNGRCLFLKNVPYKATKKSILKLFPKAIEVRFPGGAESPSQGIAFLEFKNKAVAKKVLQRKQGVKINGRVLIVDTVGESNMAKGSKGKVDTKAGATPTNTLLVSNLTDKVKEKHLKKVFPEAVSVRIRQSRFRPGMFAFVEFAAVDEAAKALKSSQSFTICRAKVKVQFCDKPKPEEATVLTTTLIVMNLAEKTTGGTLQSAFEGALSARVTIDRETGLSKRFGFVEFESEETCKAAKETMEDCEIDGSKVIVAFAKAKAKKVSAAPVGSPRVSKGTSGEKCGEGVTGKRKADSAPKTPPPKKTKIAKKVIGKPRADSAAETSPLKTEFALFVGNLNNSKQFEEIKNSLATFLMNQSLLFQDIRLDRSKKHAYVELASNMDLTKALTLNGKVVLDKPMKIAKANVKSEAKVKTPPAEKKSSKENGKKRGGKVGKRGKGKADDSSQVAAEEVETHN